MMFPLATTPFGRFFLGLGLFAFLSQVATAQELTEPVYRVAKDTPATQVSAVSPLTQAIETTEARVDFFDLKTREGEHPLAPCLRLAKRSLAEIDANIRDYSCEFSKRERIDGKLSDPNYMFMQTMHEPFGVHLLFRQPKKGQECLFVDGANNDKLLARGHGWRATIAGVLHLDPKGDRAMDGQRHPITKAGIRNLTETVIKIAENDMQYGECIVKHHMDVKLDGRPMVMIEVTHPVAQREFRFHVAKIYVDREHRVPVAFQAYSWPKEEGGKPVLEEQYIYTKLKINNGYTARDFSEDNPNYFK